jgi:hypothetical protein
MNVIDLPEEIVGKICGFLDWRSIIMFLSTHPILKELTYEKIIYKQLSNSYFYNLDISDIEEHYDDKYLVKKIPRTSFQKIKNKIRYCETNNVYIKSVNETLEYLIETIERMETYSKYKNVDVSNITFLNLDFFNNFLISNINGHSTYLKNYKLLKNIIENLIFFEKRIISSIFYTSLYSEILLKNIPNIILTILENKFLYWHQIIELLNILKVYYVSPIFVSGMYTYENSYDLIHCYMHVIKSCMSNVNNEKRSIPIYIEEISQIMLISQHSYYEIQIIKHSLSLMRFLVFYFRKIIKEQYLLDILDLIQDNKECKKNTNVILCKINVLCDIIEYIDVPEDFYVVINESIDYLNKKNIETDKLILNILRKCRKRQKFIENYQHHFLRYLEQKLNNDLISDKKIFELTFKILIDLYFIDGDTKNKLINFVKQNHNMNEAEEQNLRDLIFIANDNETIESSINNLNNTVFYYEDEVKPIHYFKFPNIEYSSLYKITSDEILKPPKGFEKLEYFQED